jgi:hypothetical protein
MRAIIDAFNAVDGLGKLFVTGYFGRNICIRLSFCIDMNILTGIL